MDMVSVQVVSEVVPHSGKSILHSHAFWTNLSHHLGTKSFCWGGSNVGPCPACPVLICMFHVYECLFTCMYSLSEFRSTRDGHEIHHFLFFFSVKDIITVLSGTSLYIYLWQ